MLRGIGVAIAAWLLVASCATAPSRTSGSWVQPDPVVRLQRLGFVVLHVHNGNAADVRVYLVRGATWVKVGTVGSFAARRFVLSPAETGTYGPLALAVETFGSRDRHIAEVLDFESGREIDFWVEGRLGLSALQPRVYRPQQ